MHQEDERVHAAWHRCRVMAELGIHLLIKAMVSVKRRRLAEYERAAVVAPLPQPMIPNNYESKGDKCFIGNHFTDVVVEKVGWWWYLAILCLPCKSLAGSCKDHTIRTP